MKTKQKSRAIVALAFLGTTLLAVGATKIDFTASADVSASTFEMKYGAQVRISENQGIRFEAVLGSDIYEECFNENGENNTGKTLGMLLVPSYYVSDYEAYCTANVEYATDGEKYYEYFATEKNGKLYNEEYKADETVVNTDGTYSIRMALVNVLFDNINVEFCPIAYVKTVEGESVSYKYADFSVSDNARSMAFVATMAREYGETGLDAYISNSVYKSVGVSYNAEDGKYVYDGISYDTVEDAFNASGKTFAEAEATYGKKYIAKDSKALDVKFMDEVAYATDWVSSGAKIYYTDDVQYVDTENGNKTAIVVKSNDGSNYADVSYNALLPENDPGYDYYEWRIWSWQTTNQVLVGPKGYVPLKEGWNTVRFNSWAELKNANAGFNRLYNDVQWSANSVWYAFGDLTGKYIMSDVQFLGKTANASDFSVASASISLTTDAQFVDTANGKTTALIVTNDGDNGIDVIYHDLLPASNPGYDYYEWRIWSSQSWTVSFGTTSRTLTQGWNTVKITWNELQNGVRGWSHIYYDWFSANAVVLAFGDMTGKYITSDVQFLGKTANASDFSVRSASISLTADTQFVDAANGKTTALIVTNDGDNEIDVIYHDLLPASDPGYDYYEWRIWSSQNWTVSFGTTSRTLAQGWNTVKITWNELQNGVRGWSHIYYEWFSANAVVLAFGDMTGKYITSDVQFLGKTANASDFSVADGTMTLSTDVQYVDTENGNTTALIVTSNANYLDVIYFDLLPASDPGYDYYELRIWCYTNSPNVSIGTTSRDLVQGWNTVRLTWNELQNGVRGWSHIYNNNMFAGGIVVYSIGNLTGYYNA